MPDASSPTLSTEQVAQVLRLLRRVDGVELKLSVADGDRCSAVAALEMDPLEAQIRQVAFFDTPELALYQRGVVVRVRRIQRKPGDTVVKLRPLVPEALTPAWRKSRDLSLEVDAMPGGFVCSGSIKVACDDAQIRDVLAGHRPLGRLITKRQRALLSDYADGVELDDLSVLGPINVLKLKFAPEGYGRRIVAELWTYPDGSRILELSIKCEPTEAFEAAAEARTFLSRRGIDLSAEQQTKTRKALEYFASELGEGD